MPHNAKSRNMRLKHAQRREKKVRQAGTEALQLELQSELENAVECNVNTEDVCDTGSDPLVVDEVTEICGNLEYRNLFLTYSHKDANK
ncbi:hypothetical protein K3495_g13802 [Podosphaera aphanis]|nr:hypothetical protein K3495_g13802 [Podosphaera aphanis]